MPHDTATFQNATDEKHVISAALAHAGNRDRFVEVLRPEDFTVPECKVIAWGIINKYRLKSPRKRGWYNRGTTRDIEDFYDLLLRVWRDAVLAETKQAFTQ